jgi:high-affinity iron transporter
LTGSALILLREGLEGALIVAIVLAYLRKLGRRDRFAAIWLGTGAAVAISVGIGVALFLTVGELQGDARKVVFAAIMASAAVVLTWMVFWMRKQARLIKGELEAKVDTALVAGSVVALAAVVFFGVLREGIETVLFFLAAAGQSSTVDSLFMVSGALVLLFAAGLLSRALAEVQILGAIPTFWYPVFDLSSVSFLATDNFAGQMLRGLFGWNPIPSIEEMAVWAAYVTVVGTLYFHGLPRPQLRRRAESLPAAAEVSDA